MVSHFAPLPIFHCDEKSILLFLVPMDLVKELATILPLRARVAFEAAFVAALQCWESSFVLLERVLHRPLSLAPLAAITWNCHYPQKKSSDNLMQNNPSLVGGAKRSCKRAVDL